MANPGQPTLYKREFCELAHNYCLLGATNEGRGDFFGVTRRILQNWIVSWPDFLGGDAKTTGGKGGKGGKSLHSFGASDSSMISIIEPTRFPPPGVGGKRRKVPARTLREKLSGVYLSHFGGALHCKRPPEMPEVPQIQASRPGSAQSSNEIS